ncbi:hypothetical protein NA56DRAFT_713606 [Hyaloscypha hepaticicola]|uniref:Uncharacterized protein n=1 Tax=Hyaloscypha hepaticicola TaxID=2082293 RepID=A0A2J6PDA6_9HELO|nr:hypothetical protein NA56DRAFT_713606 [Hyaloscypha hepaticicola]
MPYPRCCDIPFSNSIAFVPSVDKIEQPGETGGSANAFKHFLFSQDSLRPYTTDIWTEVFQLASERSNSKSAKLKDSKIGQQECSSILVAALDPSIEGESGGFLQEGVRKGSRGLGGVEGILRGGHILVFANRPSTGYEYEGYVALECSFYWKDM